MLAISHAATALLVKRRFPEAPMAWLLVAVELPAVLGPFLPRSLSDVSLLALAGALWLLVGGLLRRRALGAALASGIVLHLLLELGVQALPAPPLEMAAAMAYGLLCWLAFGGTKSLLAAIVLLTAMQFTLEGFAASQIAVAMVVVWYFSRARAAELEHPDRRLARAFA
jgi:hypothetical protein